MKFVMQIKFCCEPGMSSVFSMWIIPHVISIHSFYLYVLYLVLIIISAFDLAHMDSSKVNSVKKETQNEETTEIAVFDSIVIKV